MSAGALAMVLGACSSQPAGPDPSSATTVATAPASVTTTAPPVASAPGPSPAPSVSAPSPNTSSERTGREIGLEDAVARSVAVVVGKFTKLGTSDVGAPGQQYWDKAEIEVTSTLSGTLKGTVPVVYTVQTIPERAAEAPPKAGEELIFFLVKEGSGIRAFKMLPATSVELTSVKSALAKKK